MLQLSYICDSVCKFLDWGLNVTSAKVPGQQHYSWAGWSVKDKMKTPRISATWQLPLLFYTQLHGSVCAPGCQNGHEGANKEHLEHQMWHRRACRYRVFNLHLNIAAKNLTQAYRFLFVFKWLEDYLNALFSGWRSFTPFTARFKLQCIKISNWSTLS